MEDATLLSELYNAILKVSKSEEISEGENILLLM